MDLRDQSIHSPEQADPDTGGGHAISAPESDSNSMPVLDATTNRPPEVLSATRHPTALPPHEFGGTRRINRAPRDDTAPPAPWMSKISADIMSRFSNLQRRLLEKQDILEDLSRFIAKGTAPKHLNIRVRAIVHKDNQENVDKAVAEATKAFHHSVLQAMLVAREQERDALRTKERQPS